MIRLPDVYLSDCDPRGATLPAQTQVWYGWRNDEGGTLWSPRPFHTQREQEQMAHYGPFLRDTEPRYRCDVLVGAVQFGDVASVAAQIRDRLDANLRHWRRQRREAKQS